MEISFMNHNYRFRYLVVINGDVYVYKNDKCKFDQPVLSFQAKLFLLVNQNVVK